MALLLCLAGCGRDQGHDPDAQQLARINKELSTLSAQVAALTKRLDRLERAQGTGEPAPTPAQPDPAAPPASAERPALPPGPLVTVVVTGDEFVLGNKEVSEEELLALLRAHAAKHADAKLIIHVGRAGAKVPHERVMEIIDIAKQSGITSFSLAQGGSPKPPAQQPAQPPAQQPAQPTQPPAQPAQPAQ